MTVPEKLDYFITKFAEHIHERWCLEKVRRPYEVLHLVARPFLNTAKLTQMEILS